MFILSILSMHLASLYAGAVVYFARGLMGIFSLCVLSKVLRLGAVGLIVLRHGFCVLNTMSVHRLRSFHYILI